MNRTNTLKLTRALAGLLGASALLTEIVVLIERGLFNPTNFFSFFTVISNALAALLFIFCGAIFPSFHKPVIQIIRGAIVLYMLMTGVIFSLVLAGIENVDLTAVPWDNTVLHYIMPFVVVLDWLIDPPRKRLGFKQTWTWLLLPVAYVAYSLLRGSIVNWYPYPFLNPTHSSTLTFVITLGIMAVGIIVASWLLRLVPLRQSK